MAIVKLMKHLENFTNLEVFAYEAPKETKPPYIIYQLNSQNERLALNGAVIQTDYLVQLDIYTNTLKDSQNLKENIVDALLAFERPITYLQSETYKDEGYFYLMIEFAFFI